MDNALKNAREALIKAVETAQIQVQKTPQYATLQAATEQLTKFDSIFEADTEQEKPLKKGKLTAAATVTATPSGKKRGRPSKADIAAREAEAKAARKAVREAKKAPKASKAEAKATVNPDRPILKLAMATVMGTQPMTAPQVLEELTKRGWEPNSATPKAYISYTFSSNKELFQSVSRGVYRVKEGASTGGKKRGSKKAAAKASADSDSPPANGAEVNQTLNNLLDVPTDEVPDNPFTTS